MNEYKDDPVRAAEYAAIQKQLSDRDEALRIEKISQSSTGETSPTSLRLSPELKSKAKKLAFKRYNKTEISHLFIDLLIEALRKEGLL